MLPKHSKDIVFIVIILLLIGIIWGVPKEFWVLIMVNVIVIMVGILYVKIGGPIENSNSRERELDKEETKETVKAFDDSYEELKKMALEEIDEFLDEANYDSFENVIKGKNIANLFVDGNVGLDETIRNINSTCKFKSQMYYIGLYMISQANVEALTEKDYDYLLLGSEIIKSVSVPMETKVLTFLKNTKLKIKI